MNRGSGGPGTGAWEYCWTMPLANGFSRGTSVFPALAFQHRSILGSHVMSGDDGHLRVPAGKPVTRRVLPRPGFTPHRAANTFHLFKFCLHEAKEYPESRTFAGLQKSLKLRSLTQLLRRHIGSELPTLSIQRRCSLCVLQVVLGGHGPQTTNMIADSSHRSHPSLACEGSLWSQCGVSSVWSQRFKMMPITDSVPLSTTTCETSKIDQLCGKQCIYCDKVFSKSCNARRHEQSECTKAPTSRLLLTCDMCGATFDRGDTLKRNTAPITLRGPAWRSKPVCEDRTTDDAGRESCGLSEGLNNKPAPRLCEVTTDDATENIENETMTSGDDACSTDDDEVPTHAKRRYIHGPEDPNDLVDRPRWLVSLQSGGYLSVIGDINSIID
ncbi:hypothetical protein PR048_019207 [Dryococelus australis]|uniref:C2H2-type domain-containing protein n=1 Tax=Dryococelus australis TaxID=614101 RepID=A0ABQ9H2U5_9NEOP|nr:hypothetical protein PR048_019207 [Dryococelus australis]